MTKQQLKLYSSLSSELSSDSLELLDDLLDSLENENKKRKKKIERLKKYIEKLTNDNLEDMASSLNSYFEDDTERDKENILWEIENLEIGDNWAIYWCGYISALSDLKIKLK